MPNDENPILATEHVEKLLLSIDEAAEMVSICGRFLWGIVDAGDVPCVRIGTRVLIRPQALREWVASDCPHPRYSEKEAAKRAANAANPPGTKKRGRRK